MSLSPSLETPFCFHMISSRIRSFGQRFARHHDPVAHVRPNTRRRRLWSHVRGVRTNPLTGEGASKVSPGRVPNGTTVNRPPPAHAPRQSRFASSRNFSSPSSTTCASGPPVLACQVGDVGAGEQSTFDQPTALAWLVERKRAAAATQRRSVCSASDGSKTSHRGRQSLRGHAALGRRGGREETSGGQDCPRSCPKRASGQRTLARSATILSAGNETLGETLDHERSP